MKEQIEFKNLDPKALFKAIHGLCSPMKYVNAYYKERGKDNAPYWVITFHLIDESYALLICQNTAASWIVEVRDCDEFITKYSDVDYGNDDMVYDKDIFFLSKFTPTEGYNIVSFLKEHNIQANY